MVKVAIAGGTSPTLGRSLTEAILATGEHSVMILTRQPKEDSSEQPTTTDKSNNTKFVNYTLKHNAPVLPVDYTSVDSLKHNLSFHEINTLISVLKPLSPDESLLYHTNLLNAAQAAGVSRFILSDWSMAPASQSRVDLLAHKIELHNLGQDHMRRAQEKGEWVVECATVQNGGFLEYFVQGCADQTLQAGLVDDLMLEYIDIAKSKLVVPRNKDGKAARVSMTSLGDIGRYVAAALDLPKGKMTGRVGMAGWTGDYEEVVQMLAKLEPPVEVKEVSYVTEEDCEKVAKEKGQVFQEKMEKTGQFDVDAFKAQMVAQMVGCMCAEEDGGGVVFAGGQAVMLNELCPEVKPVDFQDLLRRAWQV